ncbi:MAG: hypothetical protein ACLSUW_01750 [Akkermansia sp.]
MNARAIYRHRQLHDGTGGYVQRLSGRAPLAVDSRFNGICDQNAYDRGELLHLRESFQELKKRSFLGHGETVRTGPPSAAAGRAGVVRPLRSRVANWRCIQS